MQGYAEVDEEDFYDERADEEQVAVESPDAESVEAQEGVQDTKPKKESVLEKIKIPTYPDKYVRPEGGGVAKVMHDKEGNREEVIICPDNLYVKKRMVDIEGPCYEIAHTSQV